MVAKGTRIPHIHRLNDQKNNLGRKAGSRARQSFRRENGKEEGNPSTSSASPSLSKNSRRDAPRDHIDLFPFCFFCIISSLNYLTAERRMFFSLLNVALKVQNKIEIWKKMMNKIRLHSTNHN